MIKKLIAECLGTFALTFIACGVAVLTGANFVATSLAFGLVIVAMAYSIGNISGCHINPAVTIAMMVRKEMSIKDGLLYMCAQVVGAFAGSLLLALCTRHFDALGGNQIQAALRSGSVVSDGVETLTFDFLSYLGAFVAELVLTFIFVFVIIAVTDKKHENTKIAGIVIGLTLTLVHLVGLGLTGTSVNPARSLAPAVIQAIAGNTTSLTQIWIWILAPLAGGVLAAVIYNLLFSKKEKEEKND